MHPLGDTMKHVRLVARMTKATGTDVVAAYDDEKISSEDWAEIIQRCRHCMWTDQCEAWLDAHETAEGAPKPCLNRTKFEEIKAAATD